MLVHVLTLMLIVADVSKYPHANDTPQVTRITSMAEWRHPAKKVFVAYQVDVEKLVLVNRTYVEFYVTLPGGTDTFDKKRFDDFIQMLARENGYWDFSLIDESTTPERLEVRVVCDKKKKKIKKIEYKSGAAVFDSAK